MPLNSSESALAVAEELGRKRRDMALGLTAIVPGLGHFVYGSRSHGVIYLLLSGAFLVVGGWLLLQFGRGALFGGDWSRPFGGLMALLLWGALYAVVLLWDARRIPGKPSRGVLAVSLIQAALFGLAIWIIMTE